LKKENAVIKQQIEEVISSGICEPSRLYHILSMIKQEKSLYKSDLAYLEKMKNKLDEKMNSLQEENKEINYMMLQQNPSIGIGRVIHTENLVDDTKLNHLLHEQKMQNKLKHNDIKSEVLPNEKKKFHAS